MTAQDLKGDCRVTVSAGEGTFVRSSVMAMYGDQILALVEEVRELFGSPACRIEVEDGGALPFIQRAQLETALANFTGQCLPAMAGTTTFAVKARARRTRLYIPGHEPRFFINATLTGADMVVFDLEDAVPMQSKAAARNLVRHAIPGLDWGPRSAKAQEEGVDGQPHATEVAIRINDGERGLADLEATCLCGVQLYLVPKVQSATELEELATILDRRNSPALLMPLIESALGVERALEICSATPRVAAVSLGMEDLILDLGAQRTPGQLESAYARGRLVNAARAAGVQPLASVFPRFENPSEVEDYVRASKQMGYEGIGCIHPSQINPAHTAFAPTADEVRWAQAIVASHADGASSVDGAMVDAPIYQRAVRVLAQSRGHK